MKIILLNTIMQKIFGLLLLITLTLSEDLNQAAAAAITFLGTTQPTQITAKHVKDFYNQNNGCSSSFENLDFCTTLQVVDHSLVCTTYNCYSGSPSVASCSARMGCGNAFCDDGSDSTHTDICTNGHTTCGGTECTSQANCAVSAATCSTQPGILDKLQCTTATAGYYIDGNQVVTACTNSITNAATVTCDADGGNVVVATCDAGYTLSAAAGDGTQTCDKDATCGEITDGGGAFACTSPRVYDSTKYAVTSPADGTCCKDAFATYAQNFLVASQESAPTGIAFNNDGTKMYVIGDSGDGVNEYALSTAFDISTATYVQIFSVAIQELAPTGIAFNNDGTKMYVIGEVPGYGVNEYALSTAFDIYTATYVQNFLVAIQESAPTGIAFNNDGTKMYVIGDSGDGVNEYALSTAFDISTATYVQNFSVASQESSPTGIAFNNDGTKMYVIGDSGVAYVNEYDLYITQ